MLSRLKAGDPRVSSPIRFSADIRICAFLVLPSRAWPGTVAAAEVLAPALAPE
jgi:hypothetical protein